MNGCGFNATRIESQNFDDLGHSVQKICRTAKAFCSRDFLYAGPPVYVSDSQSLEYLTNTGYIAAYSNIYKTPVWVAYKISGSAPYSYNRRKGRFLLDSRVTLPVRHKDYTNSGFSRGHMAPAYGIHTRYGKDAGRETFFMTNIVPQYQSLNGGIWKKIEIKVANTYSLDREDIWVITGPIFGKSPNHMKSGVSIPIAYFKILVDDDDNVPDIMSYLIPHNRNLESSAAYLTSADKIEELTGLDFFPFLDDSLERDLEERTPQFEWGRN